MSTTSFPVLSTDRLLLNQLTYDDREAIFAIFSDPEVVAHYDVEKFNSIEEADQLVDYFSQRFDQDAGIRWAIRSADTQQFLGTCGFTHWNQFDHSAVIGYELAKEHWKQGYAKEAISKILQFIFDQRFHFHVNRIEALILPSNAPSQSLVKKLGFQLEGTLREKCYWNQAFHHMNMFSLLKSDFKVQHQEE